MTILDVIRILLVLALAALWVLVVRRCMKAIDRLDRQITRMKKRQLACYPASEVHPLLRPEGGDAGVRRWQRVDEAGVQDCGPLSRLPDAEEERAYPYYNRTGQIICNAKTRTLEEVSTGRWYGYAEWLQDIISGKLIPADFGRRHHFSGNLEAAPIFQEEGEKNG